MSLLNVVYIDDEPQLCYIFKRIFSSDTVHISTYTGHAEALAAIEQSPPDLIFLDYRLEAINGDEVARMISPGIPIILVTGELSTKSTFPFLQIITKPVNLDRIQKILDDYLAKK